jgi:predicted TPR repeat methyltransferase
MTKKPTGQDILENAYKLSTPADNIDYYRQFAPFYDTDFVEHMGYQYPKALAESYRKSAKTTDVPVADIGCGTGLVAAELGIRPADIDGMDISPEMLGIARARGLYRRLYEIDLTGPLDMVSGQYGAVLSAGTFTHGHLGPGPLRSLLEIAHPGGLFIIGINRAHYEKEGFREALDAMTRDRRISEVEIDEVNIYSRAGHDHSDDRALIVQYRKC